MMRTPAAWHSAIASVTPALNGSANPINPPHSNSNCVTSSGHVVLSNGHFPFATANTRKPCAARYCTSFIVLAIRSGRILHKCIMVSGAPLAATIALAD